MPAEAKHEFATYWAALILQILAAEKAGSWSAALTLYEQALKNEGSATSVGAGPAQNALKPGSAGHCAMASHTEGGLSAARRGHLNSLLQLGHLQSLLAGVDGWMTRCAGTPAQQGWHYLNEPSVCPACLQARFLSKVMCRQAVVP